MTWFAIHDTGLHLLCTSVVISFSAWNGLHFVCSSRNGHGQHNNYAKGVLILKLNKLTLVAAAAVAFSGTALAATDGTLGLTSTGTSVVTLIKENAVQISGVADLDLGTHSSLVADATAFDDVCVFSATSLYQITVTSANGAFELSDGTNTIDYSMTWAAGGAAAPVTYNTAMTTLPANSTAPTCGGVDNATFEVTVASADFNAAAPGTYTDTVTLLVEPE